MARRSAGFANPEYLLTLAAVLVALAVLIPPFVRVMQARRDRRAVPAVRDALARYRAAHNGESPAYLQELVSSGLLKELPRVSGGGHPASAETRPGQAADDAGGWLYDAWPRLGHMEATIRVNCTHTDRTGSTCDSY